MYLIFGQRQALQLRTIGMDLWIFFLVADHGIIERRETAVNIMVTQDPLPDRRHFGSTFAYRSALGWRGRSNSLKINYRASTLSLKGAGRNVHIRSVSHSKLRSDVARICDPVGTPTYVPLLLR